MSDLARALGKRIYLFRKQNKLTQAALAERAKISDEFMSGIERGSKLPSLPTLQKIAKALGVNIKDLFAFDGSDFRSVLTHSRQVLDLATLIERVPIRSRRRLIKVMKLLVDPWDN